MQLGGGIRDAKAVCGWFELGVSRVVMGTAALKDPQFVKDMAKEWEGGIVVAVDAKGGMVATRGWAETTEVSVAEMAMLAGLPKAPSRNNPLTNPERAEQRRNYVLRRMHGLGHIDDAELETQLAAPLTASKHAVIGLTKAIAHEFAPEGIRCVAICPGSVRTQMYDNVMQLYQDDMDITLEEAEAFEAETVPLGWSCEPEEVAGVVAFLVSDAARYLTGIAVPISGGMSRGL